MFFAIFGFFLKIYQNMGQKLGSNTFHALSLLIFLVICVYKCIDVSFLMPLESLYFNI